MKEFRELGKEIDRRISNANASDGDKLELLNILEKMNERIDMLAFEFQRALEKFDKK